jgi:hypothetical protein
MYSLTGSRRHGSTTNRLRSSSTVTAPVTIPYTAAQQLLLQQHSMSSSSTSNSSRPTSLTYSGIGMPQQQQQLHRAASTGVTSQHALLQSLSQQQQQQQQQQQPVLPSPHLLPVNSGPLRSHSLPVAALNLNTSGGAMATSLNTSASAYMHSTATALPRGSIVNNSSSLRSLPMTPLNRSVTHPNPITVSGAGASNITTAGVHHYADRYVEMTPLSRIPGGRIVRYLGSVRQVITALISPMYSVLQPTRTDMITKVGDTIHELVCNHLMYVSSYTCLPLG